MTTDIHTKIMLENWGFLAEVGDWGTLEKAVNLYLEQNPPLFLSKGTSDSLHGSADSQSQNKQTN